MSDNEKIVWITGASSGIGKSIAQHFVNNGLYVAASARKEDQLTKIKVSLSGKENLFQVYPMNIAVNQEVEKTFQLVSQNYKIDCLINNAGITSFSKTIDNSTSDIQQIIETNLLGAVYAIKSVLPKMIEKKRGTIINILSVVTQKIFTESSAYSASKAGLLAYTKVLREEVRDHNIKVINIIPGATRTPIWPNSALEKYSSRMISPDDIAELIFGLYTKKSTFVPEEVVLRPIKGDL